MFSSILCPMWNTGVDFVRSCSTVESFLGLKKLYGLSLLFPFRKLFKFPLLSSINIRMYVIDIPAQLEHRDNRSAIENHTRVCSNGEMDILSCTTGCVGE